MHTHTMFIIVPYSHVIKQLKTELYDIRNVNKVRIFLT